MEVEPKVLLLILLLKRDKSHLFLLSSPILGGVNSYATGLKVQFFLCKN